ncbi:integrase, catalytic region, zinc finger, CCHC-type containing protein [Tanacetum coccineum]|uniref:Integrase, catalytic region, zinc finger, CCHC-type containing protein n=1 Tax=Tanacetum coccineum TaxID=301880 RepID=A0ABQ5G415_9ASTR
MELYMLNRPHGRMILTSVEKGPLVWPLITVDEATRLKEYIELTPAEAIQADCDSQAGRQTTYVAGTMRKYTPGASGSNTGKQRTVICYNCKGEGHISKQCTMPKRKRDGNVVHLMDQLNHEGSNEQYAEIERLKQTLSEQVQEKDSLMKTVSDFKNDLKMEENRNID